MRVALAVLAVLLCAPAGAEAAEGVEIGMEDERLLLSAPYEEGAAAVVAWRELGVDVVRLHASWSRIAPAGRRRPRGFSASDHRDRRYRWGALDGAIGLVRAQGMRVMLTVTGPGPVWTSRGPRRRGAYKPDPRAFAAFARAVARRYGRDVDRYLIWNEPNLTLSPRERCSGRRPRVCVPVAPHLYRGLVRAAGPAIEAADPGAEIVIGELAPLPIGGALGPIRFLRELACVDQRYRPIRGGRCRRFRPVAADAVGHHPHGRRRPPDVSNPWRDTAQMGDLSRLLTVVDRLTARGRIRTPGRRRLPLRLTELGYQTSPPDRYIGVSPARQARYLQKAAYLAWRNPRVKTITQYQWEDERIRRAGPGPKRYAGWQSGLHFLGGRPKPALAAFARPLVAVQAGGRSGPLLWGQVRPGGRHAVVVERRVSGRWVPRATFTTDRSGVWAMRLGRGAGVAGRYRFAVLDETGARTGAASGSVRVTNPPVRRAARLVAARV